MKRCPQCEFIYEDDQSLCDMDGQSLVRDNALLVMPRSSSPERPAKRSSLNSIALPAGAGLLLALAIFIGYTVSPTPLQPRTEGATVRTQQLDAGPPRQSDLSMLSTGSISATEPVTLEPSEPVTITKPEPNVLDKTVHAHIRRRDERVPTARTVPPLPRLRALPRLPEAKPLDTKTVRGRTSQSSAQPKTQSAATGKKDSKLGSFMKKTGRVLSKPFKL